MAGKIRLLSDEVIGKIAAGEVVERPSAAIKEMVENSLDAGATAVTVEIRDGGISYFRVTDNGAGIAQSEIRMAFERHATSKINNAQEEKVETAEKLDTAEKVEPTVEPPKVRFLENPLPLPKKHEAKVMDYRITDVADADFDFEVADDDDFDI